MDKPTGTKMEDGTQAAMVPRPTGIQVEDGTQGRTAK